MSLVRRLARGEASKRAAWVAAALARASVPDAAPVAIGVAALGGLLAWWIYRTQLRDRPGVIAPMLFCVVLLGALQPLIRPAFPGARSAAIAGLVATVIGYAIWRWLVKMDEVAA